MRPLIRIDPDLWHSSLWRVSKIYWQCIAFIGVWLVCHAGGLAGGPPIEHPRRFVIVLALAMANLTLRSLSALRRSGERNAGLRGWVFTLGDLLLIAAGLRLTGGIASGLWPVLFVVVLAETVLSPSREARPVYAAAGIALLLGTWPAAGGGIAAPAPSYFFEAGTRLFFLTIVGVLMRRIREVAQAREAELANLRAELAAAGERAHLSREIHDGIGNTLAAAVLRLEVAARVGEKRPDELSPTLLREEAQALRGSMNALRDWTFFARPWSRPDGAAGALPSRVLEQETARFGQRTGIPVVMEGADALDALGPNAQLALLRIVQEALTNAAKHAGAGRIEVLLRRDGRFVRLAVADDGRGFDPDGAAAGLGLTSMRERVQALGGTLDIDSRPGFGTTITARVPADASGG